MLCGAGGACVAETMRGDASRVAQTVYAFLLTGENVQVPEVTDTHTHTHTHTHACSYIRVHVQVWDMPLFVLERVCHCMSVSMCAGVYVCVRVCVRVCHVLGACGAACLWWSVTRGCAQCACACVCVCLCVCVCVCVCVQVCVCAHVARTWLLRGRWPGELCNQGVRQTAKSDSHHNEP